MLYRRIAFLVAFVVLLSMCIPAGERVLARDDLREYTLRDIEAFFAIQNSPRIQEIVIKAIQTNNPSLLPEARDTLESLAFKTLFVHREMEQYKDEKVLSFQVRQALREYATEKRNAQIMKECRVTTGDVELYYRENRKDYKTGERRKISVLYKVFPRDPDKREKTFQFLEKLRKKPDFKENFVEYVKKHSDLPGALMGGIVPYFSRGTYGPLLEKYSFRTPKGEISPVFSGIHGAYIVKCLDILPPGIRPLEEVSPLIRKSMFQKRLRQAGDELSNKLRESHKIHVSESASGASDQILLRVNDYQLRAGTLFTAIPELAERNIKIKPYLSRLAEGEAILQELKRRVNRYPDSPEAREMEILELVTALPLLFKRFSQKKIEVTEHQIREYYNQNRGYYHGNTPKRLACIKFLFPRDKGLSEPQYYKKIEWQYREAYDFLEKVNKKQDSFTDEAKKIAKDREDVSFEITGWLEELPGEWNSRKSIIEYTPGKISPVLNTPLGILIFQVKEKGKPRIFTYEEAREKIRGVLVRKQELALMDSLKKEILEQYRFKSLL